MEAQILVLGERERRGAVYLAGELGLMASTVGRVLHRHQVPHLGAIDPITGTPVRRRHTGIRYERPATVAAGAVSKRRGSGKSGSPAASVVGFPFHLIGGQQTAQDRLCLGRQQDADTMSDVEDRP